jgi:hypothetical protein
MRKTVICHFFNEEYLLPWWLSHHKTIFDHGIMINYQSIDKSVDLIREICPSWDIVDSRNLSFAARDVDSEVMDYESKIQGWKIALNVTEFLHGNMSLLDVTDQSQFKVPMHCMVSQNFGDTPTYSEPLHIYNTYGIPFYIEFGCRSIHCVDVVYEAGRHYFNHNIEDIFITKHTNSPFNENMLKRSLQIKDRIPEQDRLMGLGGHHFESLEDRCNTWLNIRLPASQNLQHLWNNPEKL